MCMYMWLPWGRVRWGRNRSKCNGELLDLDMKAKRRIFENDQEDQANIQWGVVNFQDGISPSTLRNYNLNFWNLKLQPASQWKKASAFPVKHCLFLKQKMGDKVFEKNKYRLPKIYTHLCPKMYAPSWTQSNCSFVRMGAHHAFQPLGPPGGVTFRFPTTFGTSKSLSPPLRGDQALWPLHQKKNWNKTNIFWPIF